MRLARRRFLAGTFGVVLAAAAFPACLPGSGESSPTPTRAAPTVPPSKQFKAPEEVLKPGKLYFVTLQTDAGDITIQLLPEYAPRVANNFAFLAQKGFYEGSLFFRIEKGSYVQTGDPLNRGTGGPGYTIEDDLNNLANVKGAVSMGKLAKDNKVGSQFFINVGDNPSFDVDRTDFKRLNPFGFVVVGMENAEKIGDGMFIRKVIVTEQEPGK